MEREARLCGLDKERSGGGLIVHEGEPRAVGSMVGGEAEADAPVDGEAREMPASRQATRPANRPENPGRLTGTPLRWCKAVREAQRESAESRVGGQGRAAPRGPPCPCRPSGRLPTLAPRACPHWPRTGAARHRGRAEEELRDGVRGMRLLRPSPGAYHRLPELAGVERKAPRYAVLSPGRSRGRPGWGCPLDGPMESVRPEPAQDLRRRRRKGKAEIPAELA
jgi:hypothetical protein